MTALCRSENATARREPDLKCIHVQPDRTEAADGRGCLEFLFVPCATGGEPTANGRAAQETAPCVAALHDASDLRRMHGVLLAFTAKHEAARGLR